MHPVTTTFAALETASDWFIVVLPHHSHAMRRSHLSTASMQLIRKSETANLTLYSQSRGMNNIHHSCTGFKAKVKQPFTMLLAIIFALIKADFCMRFVLRDQTTSSIIAACMIGLMRTDRPLSARSERFADRMPRHG